MMPLLALFCSCLFSFQLLAQVPPLPADEDTIALWNFNNDPSPTIVKDSGPHGIDGVAVQAPFTVSFPSLQLGRNFVSHSAHINLGFLDPNHYLNLENLGEWTIEFVIFPLAVVPGRRNIFENGRLSVELHDNRISASIFWNGVWRGVSTHRTLNPQIFHRVAVQFNDDGNELGIRVNNQTWATTRLEPYKKQAKKHNYYKPILIGGSPREVVTDMRSGLEHGCLSTASGDIMCWGANTFGQLGDGSFVDSNLPVLVEGLRNATTLSVGLSSSCAIASGKTFCWGWNRHNALGVGEVLGSSTAVEVSSASGATDIESGEFHTCVVTGAKTLKCWGRNQSGQLGLGILSDSALPTELPGISDIKQVSLGKNHSCAVDNSGLAYCWGQNDRGQVGVDPSNPVVTVPQQVSGLSGVVKIEAGNTHTCAMLDTNQIKCWGANESGQLGLGHFSESHVPTAVINLGTDTVADIGIGLSDHSCALVRSNPSTASVKCWGKNNFQQIGQSNISQVYTSPILVGIANQFSALRVGGNTTCSRTLGEVYTCLGSNASGVLGAGYPGPMVSFGNVVWASRHAQVTSFLDDIRISSSARMAMNRPELVLTAPLQTVSETHPQVSLQVQTSFPINSSSIQVRLNGDPVTGLVLSGTTLSGVLSSPLHFSENELQIYLQDTLGNAGEFKGTITYSPNLNPEKPIKVARRGGTSCYLTGEGYLWCWGSNAFGQFGLETIRFSSSPIQNPYIKGAKDISLADTSICAVSVEDEVYCWGSNAHGQLGNEDYYRTMRTYPEKVPLTKPLAKLISGRDIHCAIHTDGSVSCWGMNEFKSLGDTMYFNRPTAYPELSDVKDGALSEGVACFIRADDSLWCAGQNSWGELGRGYSGWEEPIGPVHDISNVKDVYLARESVCAITYSGENYCWGMNISKQAGLGDISPGAITLPRQVAVAPASVKISQTDNSTCALDHLNVLRCWGQNIKGEIGDGSFINRPNGFEHSLGVLDFVASKATVCALSLDQRVFCWGSNTMGEAGVDGQAYVGSPTEVVPHTSSARFLSSLTAGLANTCMKINDETHCWGSNEQHQLGFQDQSFEVLLPVKLAGLENVLHTSIGYGLICHVNPAQRAVCAGFNNFGQAGVDPQTTTMVDPANVLPLENVFNVQASLDSACALKSDGTVWCWGNNIVGQLGNGTYDASFVPQQVQGLTDVIQISLAENGAHACAIKSDRTLWCWGNNESGQLGIFTVQKSNVPIQVTSISNATQISLGSRFTCVVDLSQKLICFGNNVYGQLGIGNTSANSDFLPVEKLTGVTHVDTGEHFACAVDQNKTVSCWGRGQLGQLGNGLQNDSKLPVKVIGDVDEMALGAYHGCVVIKNKLACWGFNGGTYGNGSVMSSSVPVFTDINKK